MTNIRYPAQSSFDNTAPLTLTVNSTSTALKITQTGTGNAFLVEDDTSDTSPFVIDQSGNVVIGYTSAVALGGASTPAIQFHGASTLGIARWGADSLGCGISFCKSRGATPGVFTTCNSGDTIAQLDFYASDGTSMIRSSRIGAYIDAAPATNSIPGRMLFWTANSTGTLVERIRITSAGFVGIAQNTPVSQLHIGQSAGVADSGTLCFDEKDTTPAAPASGLRMKVYMKADKFIIQYNDAGAVGYKYLDLTGTSVTWVYTTTAP